MSLLGSFLSNFAANEFANVPLKLIGSYCSQNGLSFKIVGAGDGASIYETDIPAVCRAFYEHNIESAYECRRNRYLCLSRLKPNTPFITFQCSHLFNLGAIPINKNGEISEVLLITSVLFENPNLKKHAHIAQKYGFSQRAYLKRVQAISIMDRKRFIAHLAFLSDLIQTFGKEYEQKIVNTKVEIKKQLSQSSQSHEVVTDLHNNLIEVDDTIEILTGIPPREFLGLPLTEYLTDLKQLPDAYYRYPLEPLILQMKNVEGSVLPVLFYESHRQLSKIVWKMTPVGFLHSQNINFRQIMVEDRFESILTGFQEMFLILDFEGNIHEFRPFREEDPLNSLFRLNLSIAKPQDFPDGVHSLLEKIVFGLNFLKNTDDFNQFKVHCVFDGEETDYLCRLTQTDADEAVVILRNITESESKMRILQGIASIYRRFSEVFDLPVFSYNIRKKTFEYLSENYLKFVEIEAGELSDAALLVPENSLPAEDVVRIRSEIRSMMEGQFDRSVFYYRIFGENGRLRSVREKILLESGESGEPAFLNGMLEDVTDQVDYEEDLTERADFLKSLVLFYQRISFGASGEKLWRDLVSEIAKKMKLEHLVTVDVQDGRILQKWISPAVHPEDFEKLDFFFISQMTKNGWKQDQLKKGEILYGGLSEFTFSKGVSAEDFANSKNLALVPMATGQVWSMVLLLYDSKPKRQWGVFEVEKMRLLARATSLILCGSQIKEKNVPTDLQGEKFREERKKYRALEKFSRANYFEFSLEKEELWFPKDIQNFLGFAGNSGRDFLLFLKTYLARSEYNLLRLAYRSLLAGKDEFKEMQLHFTLFDGSRRVFKVLLFLLDSSEPIENKAICGFVLDLTPQKDKEDEVLRIQRQNEALEKLAEVGFWTLDVRNKQIWHNEQCFRIAGFEPGSIEITFDNWMKRVHPEDLPNLMRQLETWIENPSDPFYHEYRLRSFDDSYLWLVDKGEVVETDTEGRAVLIRGVTRDMTMLKEIQSSLTKSGKRQNILFEKFPIGVYILSRARLEYINPVLMQWLGLSFVDLSDEFLVESLIHEDSLVQFKEIQKWRLSGEEGLNDYPLNLKKKDGGRLSVRIFTSLLSNEPFRILGVIVRE